MTISSKYLATHNWMKGGLNQTVLFDIQPIIERKEIQTVLFYIQPIIERKEIYGVSRQSKIPYISNHFAKRGHKGELSAVFGAIYYLKGKKLAIATTLKTRVSKMSRKWLHRSSLKGSTLLYIHDMPMSASFHVKSYIKREQNLYESNNT